MSRALLVLLLVLGLWSSAWGQTTRSQSALPATLGLAAFTPSWTTGARFQRFTTYRMHRRHLAYARAQQNSPWPFLVIGGLGALLGLGYLARLLMAKPRAEALRQPQSHLVLHIVERLLSMPERELQTLLDHMHAGRPGLPPLLLEVPR